MVIYKRDTLDRTFHALSDGSRRKMLDILSEGKSCSATELGEPLSMSQPAASKHIKVLEAAGLVSRMVQGRTHLFSLNKTPLDEAENWITAHKAFWGGALEQLDALAQSIDKETTGKERIDRETDR